jgi:hypothetical protein
VDLLCFLAPTTAFCHDPWATYVSFFLSIAGFTGALEVFGVSTAMDDSEFGIRCWKAFELDDGSFHPRRLIPRQHLGFTVLGVAATWALGRAAVSIGFHVRKEAVLFERVDHCVRA